MTQQEKQEIARMVYLLIFKQLRDAHAEKEAAVQRYTLHDSAEIVIYGGDAGPSGFDTCTWGEFREANADGFTPEELVNIGAALVVGEIWTGGGGAAPRFVLAVAGIASAVAEAQRRVQQQEENNAAV